ELVGGRDEGLGWIGFAAQQPLRQRWAVVGRMPLGAEKRYAARAAGLTVALSDPRSGEACPGDEDVVSHGTYLYHKNVFRNLLAQLEPDLAGGVIVEAVARVAAHRVRLDVAERAGRQARPHATIELDRLG